MSSFLPEVSPLFVNRWRVVASLQFNKNKWINYISTPIYSFHFTKLSLFLGKPSIKNVPYQLKRFIYYFISFTTISVGTSFPNLIDYSINYLCLPFDLIYFLNKSPVQILWKPNFYATILHCVPLPDPLLPKTMNAFGLDCLMTFG